MNGVTGFFGVRTLDAKDVYQLTPTAGTRSDFYTERTLANAALGAAVAAAAIGIVLWVVDGPASKKGASRQSRAF